MSDRGGFIVMWRKALDSWLFDLPDTQFKIAVRILLEANWKETTVFRRGQRLVIGRGQLILSEAGLAKRCKCSRGAVRRTLGNLEKVGFLSLDTSPGCTVVTILNYDRYQDKPEEASPEVDPKRARSEPEADPKRARSEQGNKETSPDYVRDAGQEGFDFGDGYEDPAPKPKRPRRQPADDLLDAFARGAGDKFIRPEALDRRTAPMLNKLWRDLRDSDAGYTLADIEAAGRSLRSWRNKPADIGWLTYGTNLVGEITRAKNRTEVDPLRREHERNQSRDLEAAAKAELNLPPKDASYV